MATRSASRSSWASEICLARGSTAPDVDARLERASASLETILLLGESGTGKEILARAVHDTSQRRDGPFVVFDCSAIAPNLVEDELFGHVKGAFTGAQAARPGVFEQAIGGTLFIDEIGELPLELQPKLLRVLETRQARRIGAALMVSADVGDLKGAPPAASDSQGSAELRPFLEMPLRDARSTLVERFERDYLRAMLRRMDGNVIRASEAMGVSRQMVYKMMTRYGLE